MRDGETRTVSSVEELRECPEHAVFADARHVVGKLAARAGGVGLPAELFIAGAAGRQSVTSLTYPVEVWWPNHPTPHGETS